MNIDLFNINYNFIFIAEKNTKQELRDYKNYTIIRLRQYKNYIVIERV